MAAGAARPIDFASLVDLAFREWSYFPGWTAPPPLGWPDARAGVEIQRLAGPLAIPGLAICSLR